MIALIVNADDLGTSRERDRGIIEAFANGLVTSASLLANGDSFATAVTQVKTAGLPVGVHLNLSEGVALTGRIAGLTLAGNRFPGKWQLRQCLADGACDLAALRAECQAQVETVFAAGLTPDHLDSHQHCQLFPCLAPIIAELAEAFGIRAIRNPRPAEPSINDPSGPLGDELALYRQLSLQSQAHEGSPTRLSNPDGLWGMPLLNRLDTHSLCRLLGRIPAGTWELMVHPGYPNREHSFSGPQRHAELEALTSAEAKAVVEERRIRLISFGELPCAS